MDKPMSSLNLAFGAFQYPASADSVRIIRYGGGREILAISLQGRLVYPRGHHQILRVVQDDRVP